MAAKTKSKVTPKYKTKYRVKNWPADEAALRKRGDIMLWFAQEVARPAQDGLRGHHTGHLAKQFAPEGLALDRQTPPFFIGQAELTVPSTAMNLAQDTVLFFQVADDLLLPPIPPPAEQQEQKGQGRRWLVHFTGCHASAKRP